jgi:hypothetical protein
MSGGGAISHTGTFKNLAVVLACLAAGATATLWLGQDANFDLGNYHFYNAYALLDGRGGLDLAAAGSQSWINPLLDVPYGWLALGPLAHYPRILAAVMGLWYGALIAAVVALSTLLYRGWPGTTRWVATVAATLLAVTGAAVLSQAGRTFNEIQTGMLVVGAIALLVWNLDRPVGADVWKSTFAAGFLLGAAAGLKITSAIYGPAACVALFASMPIRTALKRASLLVLGGITGLAVAGGWWGYRLYATFQNPVFPYFNGIFRSTWFPPVNLFDRRFLPHDIWQTLFYPLFWLSGKGMLVTEPPFRDGRIAAAFVLFLGLGIFLLFRRKESVSVPGGAAGPSLALRRSHRFLLSFLACSYVLWICTTAILRYAVPVEVSAAVSIPLLLWRLLHVELSRWRRIAWIALVIVITSALLISTRYPDWGRVPYGPTVLRVDMKWLPRNSLVVLLGAPIAYVAPFASPESHAEFVGFADVTFESRGFRLANAVVEKIRRHAGPVVVVWDDSDTWMLPTLADMGLAKIAGSCHTFFSTFEAEHGRLLDACLAHREVPARLHDAFWRIAAARYSEVWVPEPAPRWSYAAFVRAVGRLAMGKHFVDNFEFLWSREPGRPRQFDDKILPDTLYVLNPALRSRALRAMNRSTDLLATIDGVLVLAPGWKSSRAARPF